MTEIVKEKKAKKSRKWNVPATILTLLLAGAFFIFLAWGKGNGPYKLMTAGNPAETAGAFMDALVAGDEETARGFGVGSLPLSIPKNTGDDGAATRLYTALLASYDYGLAGQCQVEGLTAVQPVTFQFLHMSAMEETIAGLVQENLARYVDERDYDSVYDEARNYLPSVIEEAYAEAVETVCKGSLEEFMISQEVEIQLVYENGSWLVKETGNLNKNLLGEKPQEAANDFTSSMQTLKAECLQGLTYIRKIYTIPEHAMSPSENQACYGETTDPYEVLKVIESASELLEGQEVAYDPEVNFAPRSKIKYYYDETLLVICWKEIIEGKCCAMAEIKIAHGSQLRRTIAGGEYGSSIQLLPSTMARESNAVLAINGDFYAFRPLGITVYDRKVYRFAPQTLDTCYFTASGDMLFTYAGEPETIEDAQKFVDDHDITFAVAFGPVLVDHGVLRDIKNYPIGEVNEYYSRTTFAQKDHLHYLLMCINYEGVTRAATIQQSAQFIYDKGVQMAYALDGGQTSTLVFNDSLYNVVDFNAERLMSDIIYFSTALPEED